MRMIKEEEVFPLEAEVLLFWRFLAETDGIRHFPAIPGRAPEKIRKKFRKSVDKCVYVVYILIYTDYARSEYTER